MQFGVAAKRYLSIISNENGGDKKIKFPVVHFFELRNSINNNDILILLMFAVGFCKDISKSIGSEYINLLKRTTPKGSDSILTSPYQVEIIIISLIYGFIESNNTASFVNNWLISSRLKIIKTLNDAYRQINSFFGETDQIDKYTIINEMLKIDFIEQFHAQSLDQLYLIASGHSKSKEDKVTKDKKNRVTTISSSILKKSKKQNGIVIDDNELTLLKSLLNGMTHEKSSGIITRLKNSFSDSIFSHSKFLDTQYTTQSLSDKSISSAISSITLKIINAIINDYRIHANVKASLKSMSSFFDRLILQDNSFLYDVNHPGRHFIDLICAESLVYQSEDSPGQFEFSSFISVLASSLNNAPENPIRTIDKANVWLEAKIKLLKHQIRDDLNAGYAIGNKAILRNAIAKDISLDLSRTHKQLFSQPDYIKKFVYLILSNETIVGTLFSNISLAKRGYWFDFLVDDKLHRSQLQWTNASPGVPPTMFMFKKLSGDNITMTARQLEKTAKQNRLYLVSTSSILSDVLKNTFRKSL